MVYEQPQQAVTYAAPQQVVYEQYPVPVEAVNAIASEIQKHAALFVTRTGSEKTFQPVRELSCVPPKRLCGQIYGPGRCKTHFSAANQVLFESVQSKLSNLSLHGAAEKSDLDAIHKHLKCYHLASSNPYSTAGVARPKKVMAS